MANNLLQDFINHNASLIQTNTKLLVGVSGGVDSMVLVYLFLDMNVDFEIAHVNFQLRGKESDGDAAFVQEFCAMNDIVYHQLDVDAAAYAKNHKISIQEAARQIRYEWFEKTRAEINAQWIVVAHQKNDIAETVIFNLTRGAGIAGLHGIKAQNGFILRPLLFAERQAVIAYAKENDIAWREDSSNTKTKYARNLIRHKVMPLLAEINPSVVQNIAHNALIMSEIEVLLKEYLDAAQQMYVTKDANEVRMNLKQISRLATAKTILFYLLKDYGFNETQVRDMLSSGETSKVFLSSQKRAVIHGEFLLVTDFAEDTGRTYLIESWSNEPIITPEFSLSWAIESYHGQRLPDDDDIVWLDRDKMIFPLILRKRKAGDRFQPFGMGGKSKKIKDFLANLKLSVPEKEKVWLLESGDGQICWVVGHRIDERYKIQGSTKEMIAFSLSFGA